MIIVPNTKSKMVNDVNITYDPPPLEQAPDFRGSVPCEQVSEYDLHAEHPCEWRQLYTTYVPLIGPRTRILSALNVAMWISFSYPFDESSCTYSWPHDPDSGYYNMLDQGLRASLGFEMQAKLTLLNSFFCLNERWSGGGGGRGRGGLWFHYPP
jgi:hypothetical protein